MSHVAFERSATSMLWQGWSLIETVDETIEVAGLTLRRAGATARSRSGQTVTGAAADLDDAAVVRASFELLERASLIDAMTSGPDHVAIRRSDGSEIDRASRCELFAGSDAPEHWMPSRSNGVALARDWPSACHGALLELVERDRLMRSWCGEGVPNRIDRDIPVLSAATGYEWSVARFPFEDHWNETIEVVMIIGFPQDERSPLLRGSAAAETLDVALEKAARECLQALAFLWGEDIPSQPPTPAPSPLHHVDHYLWRGAHAVLRGWLAGAHAQFGRPAELQRSQRRNEVTWADLTPPALRGRYCVAQARCDAALPLFFGQGPSWWTRALPRAVWTHPIA